MGKSNLPYVEDESVNLCPMFDGLFAVENYMISSELIPRSMEKGIYKGVILIYHGDVVASAVEGYVKLY